MLPPYRLILLTSFIVLLLSLAHLLPPPAQSQPTNQPELSPGFLFETVVTGLQNPVDFEFDMEGALFIIEKGHGDGAQSVAALKRIAPGEVEPRTVLHLGVDNYWERGTGGLVLDPHFAHNGYLYLTYNSGEASLDWAGESYLRLSRFTYNPVTQLIDPTSELILLDGLSPGVLHHGGGLLFDTAENLLVAVGDGGEELNPQNLLARQGKILRLRPTAVGYDIPADNPFLDEAENNAADSLVYAFGLRNPFRLIPRPKRLAPIWLCMVANCLKSA